MSNLLSPKPSSSNEGLLVGSVVIPAYNEGSNIVRLLERLTCAGAENRLEILVVCNGCSDNTYELAKAFSDKAKIENLSRASKTNALNHGDQLATVFPRAYLDADIEIDGDSLCDFLEQFSKSSALAGGLNIRFDQEKSPLIVRCFYRVWQELPCLLYTSPSPRD